MSSFLTIGKRWELTIERVYPKIRIRCREPEISLGLKASALLSRSDAIEVRDYLTTLIDEMTELEIGE